MRIAIRHTSRYQYYRKIPYALQRLRLRPPLGHGQTPQQWQVTIGGLAPCAAYLDGFGNHVDLAAPSRETQEVVIVAEGIVETEDLAGIYGEHDAVAPPWVFERPTPLTQSGKRVRALADTVRHATQALEAMHALMIEVHGRVAYVPGSSGVDTDTETTLRNGHGVCQDHAHVMIAAARDLGLPARYVSGYLLMHETAVQTAGHAWAEVFVDGLGWIGFDAANNQCPDERYVRVACGLDYRDAQPVTGLRSGVAEETLSVEVVVAAVLEQRQGPLANPA